MSQFFPTPEEFSRHDVFQGVTVRTCSAEKMMLSVAELASGAVVEEHAHPHEQVGIILEGKVLFTIGGEEKKLGPGDLFRLPGNVRHKVVVLEGPAKALDIFCPPREDYR